MAANTNWCVSDQLDPALLQYPDRLADFYVGKTVFISGGSGFMGKVLVEKLLRSCPGLKRMYLLMRTKKGKDPNERLQEIFDGPLFNLIREKQGEDFWRGRVEAIPGNIEDVELGITKEDRNRLAKEVEVIFNGAATIRFDEALKKAVLLNVRGTYFMLQFAKMCKKLLVFCHISTAYCHLHERILYEKPYPPPADPHSVIKAIEWMSDDVINSITDKLLGDIPNSYAFTKALGEALAVEEMDNLPIVILRPSIVIPIWREPLPGWTDNINGPTGLLIGAGKGVIRTMYCKGGIYADYVPVDICVNAIMLSVYDYVAYGTRRIYNVTSSSEYKISFEEVIDIGRRIVNENMPLNGVVWYPGGSMKRSRLVHNICFFLFHIIPALFIDALLLVLGYDPVLIRVQKRIAKGFDVFEYYTNKQWDFDNEESLLARNLMNPREKELYKIDGNGVNYKEYFTNCVHAARLYILKEPDDTLPAARRHMKVMWCVDKICKTLIIGAFLYFVITRLIMPIMGYEL